MICTIRRVRLDVYEPQPDEIDFQEKCPRFRLKVSCSND